MLTLKKKKDGWIFAFLRIALLICSLSSTLQFSSAPQQNRIFKSPISSPDKIIVALRIAT